MPMRSAIMPTSGTHSPPVPQAKPIISDDTVAALAGAIRWPNDEFTMAANAAGISYDDLVQRIVDLAKARYGKSLPRCT